MEKIRCTYSVEGQNELQKRNQNRKGYIVGHSRNPNIILILWDGRKTKESYHTDFIQVIPDEPDPILIDQLKKSEIF